MIAEEIKPLTREEQFIQLYETAFPPVAAFVRKMNGSFDDAKDIFQDALVIYYEKKLAGIFLPEYDEQHYVKGIARHLWYKRFKEATGTKSLNDSITLTEEEEPKVSESILQYIELSGKKCLELLRSFYYDKLNMKELAQQFGFAGERSATAQKYKCLEKVRNAIKQRALSREDFYE